MTTTYEDAPDSTSGAEETASPETRAKVRRFAPRRSRSANLPTLSSEAEAVQAENAPEVPASTESGNEAAATEFTTNAAAAQAQPDLRASSPLSEAERDEPAPPPQTAQIPVRPARRSRSRKASPAEPVTAVVADPTTVPVAAAAAPTPAEEPVQVPVVESPTPATRNRSRRRSQAPSAVTPTPVVEAAETAPVAPIGADPIEPEPPAEQPRIPARPARARRTRSRSPRPPVADLMPPQPIATPPEIPEPGPSEMQPSMESSAPALDQVESSAPIAQDEQEVQSAPHPALEEESPPAQAAERVSPEIDSGDEILAKALRELFPLAESTDSLDEAETAPERQLFADLPAYVETTSPDEADDDLDESADELSLGDSGETAESEDSGAFPRRGRRGRRGGRGRRRNGGLIGPVVAEAGAMSANGFAPESVAPIAATPTTSTEPTTPLFTPESPARSERSWREHGPRRQWGRTYSRESQVVRMPPPKPIDSLRPGPIPQAAPPLAAVADVPELQIPAASAFIMPDLRIDAPLAPGETRSERLLEAQTRLLQAMLEQQSRQIDMLTASISGLRQTVQQLSATTTRGYLPRTAIFVDAPNVCYAADNARVNLDFGRMLKYLSKDRHLVHAFSYAPITDDVRDGIRYETQRFVAPFLRTGYKLVTKPLKRFPDGSAKGNFDIELAIDIVTMSERLDVVVLVSGDSDFERLIELIQSKGVRVEVVAFASNVSTELVNIADVFIDINQHLEHMRAL